MTAVVLMVLGLAALVAGAEVMVRSASSLATTWGIPPLVVGLTVVSIGTSMPELAVGIDAARQGSPELAVGNIVGTNLVNLMLILGISALLVPILLDRFALRRDLPAMVASALMLGLLALDGELGQLDGLVLLLMAIGYTVIVVRTAKGSQVADTVLPVRTRSSWVELLILVAGLATIVLGAHLLVDGATRSARSLGVSEAVIGLTVVAIGTSAPELVTTVVSTLRGQRDVALGNLLGSSTYNIALVLGVTVLASPHGVPVPRDVLGADLLMLGAVAAVSVPVFVSGGRITRLEGGLGVAAYLAYLSWVLATRT
jgi:cation:H+ antiporter